MFFGQRESKSFMGVAMLFIFLGIIIFVFGALGWLINSSQQLTIMNEPSAKVMGGLIIMALGYIQLELGLLRRK
ncbi:MAG TPA: hypothetical protein VLE93_00700 [Candidatus Saccharimonadales bacterium]|nr:hypothetical protein [Candidatus Saccharimonadales bacterium]